MNRPAFPEAVDSSMLATFKSCHRKQELTHLEHWKPKNESIHLVAGKAYASGLERARRSYYEGGFSQEQAIAHGTIALLKEYGTAEVPDDTAKTPQRMCEALDFYFEQYPLAEEKAIPHKFGDRLGIEFNFAEPIDVKHPETGNPILYTGRSDMICDFADGIYIEDDKTASQLGPSWGRQWDLRSQFTGYTWGAKYGVLQLPVQGVLVRGVSILKTKFGTQQAITNRADWEIERWYEGLIHEVNEMVRCWESGFWSYNLDHACTEYGGCQFTTVCKSPTPGDWLPMYFERRRWDPLTREETPVVDPAEAA